MSDENGALAVAIAVALVASLAGLAGPAGAGHGADNGNYTVGLPFDSDHYPRKYNDHNASINHFAGATPELFDRKGIPEGVEQIKFVIIENQDIDFSQCKTENTAAFGIDRDSDDPGTETDVDLLSYRENSQFNPHSIVVNFFEGDEIAAASRRDKGGKEGSGKGAGREDGDKNAELYPDDQIVAHQGYKSAGGPCYGMPTEPGWYQIYGFMNGTGFNGKEVSIDLPSHYFYICKCDSEKAAYRKLGAPPGQDNPYTEENEAERSSATATPTATRTATPAATSGPGSTDDGPTSTPTATPGRATATSNGSTRNGGESTASDDARTTRSGDARGGSSNDGSRAPRRTATPVSERILVTPTVAAGPGFGVGLALVALAGAALLAVRS